MICITVSNIRAGKKKAEAIVSYMHGPAHLYLKCLLPASKSFTKKLDCLIFRSLPWYIEGLMQSACQCNVTLYEEN